MLAFGSPSHLSCTNVSIFWLVGPTGCPAPYCGRGHHPEQRHLYDFAQERQQAVLDGWQPEKEYVTYSLSRRSSFIFLNYAWPHHWPAKKMFQPWPFNIPRQLSLYRIPLGVTCSWLPVHHHLQPCALVTIKCLGSSGSCQHQGLGILRESTSFYNGLASRSQRGSAP